jgi:CRP-like cAMP-binding protein
MPNAIGLPASGVRDVAMTSIGAVGRMQSNLLLAALPPAELALLAPALRDVALVRGTVLYEPGDLIEDVYFPHDALISLTTAMRDGESIETAAVGRESALGMTLALDPSRSSSRVIVQVAGTAARIRAAEFAATAARSAALRDLVSRCSELLIAQLQQSVACNALHDTQARLSRFLLEYNDRAGDDMAVTQEFLAQTLGVRRTTVTVIAQILQSAGMIRYRRGIIRIVDRPALEHSACECYHAIRQRSRQLLPRVHESKIA